MKPSTIAPEYIEKLEKLKTELEAVSRELKNIDGKSQYEIEGRMREFQDKESEIKQFLREHVLN
ncbi:MAG: hypothetical protein HQL80_13775 [Magnetococcales bacterium]|nr:hypothetical protein [Magnetococcales bacterium]